MRKRTRFVLFCIRSSRNAPDLSQALARLAALDPGQVVACFLRYLAHGDLAVTRAEFEDNLADKTQDQAFLRDVPPLLAAGISHHPVAVLARVREVLLSQLPEGAPQPRRRR